MKSHSFIQGVGLALVVSLLGSLLFALFKQTASTELAWRLVIALAAAAYLLFLLRGSSARVGMVTTVLAWSAISGLTWLLHPSLLVYLLIHMGLLWLVRSLYFYRNLLAVLMDMGLQGISFATAVWALQETGSILPCLWSFFLVQALFVAIPPHGFGAKQPSLDSTGEGAGFQRAYLSAEAALRRLSSYH